MSNKITIEAELNDRGLELRIADAAEKKLAEELTTTARKIIFDRGYHGYREDYYLQDWLKDYIKETIANEKDTIIEKAAEALADSMRRSKPVREKFGEFLDEKMGETE